MTEDIWLDEPPDRSTTHYGGTPHVWTAARSIRHPCHTPDGQISQTHRSRTQEPIRPHVQGCRRSRWLVQQIQIQNHIRRSRNRSDRWRHSLRYDRSTHSNIHTVQRRTWEPTIAQHTSSRHHSSHHTPNRCRNPNSGRQSTQDLATRRIPTPDHTIPRQLRQDTTFPRTNSARRWQSTRANVARTSQIKELHSSHPRRNHHKQDVHSPRYGELHRQEGQTRQDTHHWHQQQHTDPTRTKRLGPPDFHDDFGRPRRDPMGLDTHTTRNRERSHILHRAFQDSHTQERPQTPKHQGTLGHFRLGNSSTHANIHPVWQDHYRPTRRPSPTRRHPFTTTPQETERGERKGQRQEQIKIQIQLEPDTMVYTTPTLATEPTANTIP